MSPEHRGDRAVGTAPVCVVSGDCFSGAVSAVTSAATNLFVSSTHGLAVVCCMPSRVDLMINKVSRPLYAHLE